jgi:hypothetical protein
METTTDMRGAADARWGKGTADHTERKLLSGPNERRHDLRFAFCTTSGPV